ncbi:MAG: HepT-like ribonuclease domain-containing protein [Dermatophilaceae bacterium]
MSRSEQSGSPTSWTRSNGAGSTHRTYAPTTSRQWRTTPCCATSPSSGKAVRSLPRETREAMPGVPWASIAGLRHIVVHEYFRVNPDLILDIVNHQLVDLASAIRNR